MASILFSPFTAIFENKAAGTAIIGKPGSGKTFFILNLCANAIMMEQKVFGIDPKDDMGVLCDIFPNIEYININDIKPGSLNPFRVIKNIDTNTLSSIISIICGDLTDDQIIAITPIVNDFINKYRKESKANTKQMISFADVADYLYANDNIQAQAVGTKLQIHRDSKYGPLLFEPYESENEDEFHFDKQSKIISLHGMDLPKYSGGAVKLTEEQKFNSGIVYIICKMLKDILTEGKYPTLFVMDEAHIAFQNESFASIIDEFLILGRSLNVATVLASQSVSHYPKDIAQLISSKFCFKSSSNDASVFLNTFLNDDGNNSADFSSIVYQIGEFASGDCYYIDSENRSGIFHVTSLLSDDITSNPLEKKRKPKNINNN